MFGPSILFLFIVNIGTGQALALVSDSTTFRSIHPISIFDSIKTFDIICIQVYSLNVIILSFRTAVCRVGDQMKTNPEY